MNIMGISAFYHDAACCLIQDGRLLAAAGEERFSRIKNDPRLPVSAFRFCMAQAGLNMEDLDRVAYYEDPEKKLARQLATGRLGNRLPDPNLPARLISELLGYDGPIDFFDHHDAHAASAFFFSPFKEAAVMTVDGVGEWDTTSYALGRDRQLTRLGEVAFPHSLGLFYATVTAYLGFRVNSGEYKVMGLAPYGQPRYVDQLRRLIRDEGSGRFRLEMAWFDFVAGARMFTPALEELLGQPARRPESPLTQFHMDVARSLQVVTETQLLHMVHWLHQQTDVKNLCMAGGVALNCVANGRILREGPFEKLFVQPAAGDAGGALGAAALSFQKGGGRVEPMRHAFLGPAYDHETLARILADCGLKVPCFAGREAALLAETAALLAADRVVGWFQGAMEFGPRALGARSILANPMSPTIRDRLNGMVKKRESFRPFAPSVLADHASAHFALDHASPYMLETCRVQSDLALPGITHVDGSARPQTVDAETNPRFAALIQAFYRQTGCPMVVNTSFNVRGEPIVCSPVDALRCMANAGLDALVLGDFLIKKEALPEHWAQLLPHWEVVRRSAGQGRSSVISEHLYTFV